jgi:hypothetical protein
MEILALVLLFIEPAAYRFRSKGWPDLPFTRGAAALMLAGWAGLPLLGFYGALLLVLAPVAVLVLSFVLPGRPGAPGPGYLVLRHPCPHCGSLIRRRRREEGRPVLCDACGSIVTLPGPGAGPPVLAPARVPVAAKAEVCLASYLHPQHAEYARGLLESSGVESRIDGMTLALAHPMISFAGGGVRLVVPSRDAEDAAEILRAGAWPAGEPFDESAAPSAAGPDAPQETPTSLVVLQALVLVVVVPAVVGALASLLGPILAPGLFPSGRLPEEDRMALEMRVALLTILIRLGAAAGAAVRPAPPPPS